MNAEPTERRESIPLTSGDVRVVDRLTDPNSFERHALNDLTDGQTAEAISKAALLRAALHTGTDHIRDKATELGYQDLAASMTADEVAEDKAITRSRRKRQQELGNDE